MNPAVAAVLVVRDEQPIIATCIGHLLSLGVARIHVIDNGSADRTPAILRRIAALTGRLTIETDPGDFRQADLLTALAHRARAEGADWILPSDADEFLWLERGTSLATLCRTPGIGGYRLPVRNFVQARPVTGGTPLSLLGMLVTGIPTGGVAEARARVTAGELPFLRITYPAKLLLRATPCLRIAFGNHDAVTADPLVDLDRGELLHAPIRSPACLRRRAAAGRRVRHVTPDPDQNWHLKRVAAMDEAALALEWRRNSFHPLWPVHPGATRLDTRLARIALRQSAFARRAGRPD